MLVFTRRKRETIMIDNQIRNANRSAADTAHPMAAIAAQLRRQA